MPYGYNGKILHVDLTTGTLNMADLAQRLPAVEQTRTVHAAFGRARLQAGQPGLQLSGIATRTF